jgi:ribonucleoside-diphosphate reductase alpha chain
MIGGDWVGVPVNFSNEELKCLGFIFGDANYHKASKRYKYVYIGKEDTDVETLFKNIGETLEESNRYDKRLISPVFAKKCKEMDFPGVPLPLRFLPDTVLQLPPYQLKAFLRGLFSANGSVLSEAKRVTFKSTCSELINQLQIILMALGIKSYVTTNRGHEVEFSNGIYNCKESYDLNITSDDVVLFEKEIGFVQDYKQFKLSVMVEQDKGRRLYPTVTALNFIGDDYVYDFTEPKNHWAFVNGLKVHNCGEQPLLPEESCNLGSINLLRMVNENNELDIDKLEFTVRAAVRFLDNIIDLNKYPLPGIAKMTCNNRKIGLGVMGFADMLVRLEISYNSPEALELAKTVMKFIRDTGHDESHRLAKERGVFPNFKGSIFDGKMEMRNATITTIAPTGTLSMIASCSSGIEPLFSLVYEKNVLDGRKFLEIHPDFLKVAKEEGFYSEDLMKTIMKSGGISKVAGIPQKICDVYVTAHDIDPQTHIAIQAAFQEYTDNAVSKTINFGHDATIKEVEEAYLLAYESGCKGLTVYRDGSRENQVMTVGTSERAKILSRDIKLPSVFKNGDCRVIKKEGKKFYIHFSYLPEDSKHEFPIVLWIHTNAKYKPDELKICNKASRNLSALALDSGVNPKFVDETLKKANDDYPHNRLGRMVSLCLRHNVPREDILVSLTGIDGDNVSTLLAAVRKFLSETLPNGTTLKGLKCPECGGDIRMEEGCKKCVCGWSACN